MDRIRKFLVRIFTPPVPALLFLAPLSVFLLILSLGDYGMPFLFQWISFTLSAYTLAAICCSIHPIQYILRTLCRRFPLLQRYLEDIQFHIGAGLAVSQLINLAYALLQLSLGIWHQSLWYCSMAFYYAMLFLMRIDLITYIGRHDPGENPEKEWKRYRFCGGVILLLTTVLAGVVTMTIYYSRFPVQNMIVAIAMATYTFVTLALSVWHLFSYRRYHSPVYMASACVSLTSGLVSLLNLSATMLGTFAEEQEDVLAFNRAVTAAGGALIYVLILILSFRMLRRAHRELGR